MGSVDSDAIAAALAKLEPSITNSRTMNLDQSQPPTPDGTGLPANFQVIAPTIYRCSYPVYAHFETLATLELKTVITLVEKGPDFDYANFLSTNGITHHHIPILANKSADTFTDPETVHRVLNLMLDPGNYPLLIHCNKGKHRTGCMVACFRKVTGWTAEACIEEYEAYSAPKSRSLDKDFISSFDASDLKPLALERGYVGGVYRQPVAGSTKSSIYTTYTAESDESDYPGRAYQERVKRENDALLESARLWSYK